MSEHLCHVEVEGLHSVGLDEREVGVASGLAYDVERCAFALGDAAHVFDMFLVDEQTHTFLALVGNDFFC